MKIVKKINNNVAIGRDQANREVVVFGKGIGFADGSYELTDLSRIDRTYYDIDPKYVGLLNEIPEHIFTLVSKLLEIAKGKLNMPLNPNLVFILADHIHFSIERYRKGIYLALPYSYELEYEYPEFTKVAKWFIKHVNQKMRVELEPGEVTSIVMHLINASENLQQEAQGEKLLDHVIRDVTDLVESSFQMQIDRSSFNYFRFKNHLKYFVQRRKKGEQFQDSNRELYLEMKKIYPEADACVAKIDKYLQCIFQEPCSEDELLYLMVHVNRLYTKEEFKNQ